QNINVDVARSPMPLARAVEAEPALAVHGPRQELVRTEGCGNLDGGIDERGLLGHAPRRCLIIGRTGDEPHSFVAAHAGDRALERRAYLADIAAQRHEGFGHGEFGPIATITRAVRA